MSDSGEPPPTADTISAAGAPLLALQITISGYRPSKPCTLFAAWSQESRALVIVAEAAWRQERRPGALVIANDPGIADRDVLFGPEHFSDAVAAYFALRGGVRADGSGPCLEITERAVRANPDSAIESDGYNESGPKYRIAESISALQVATLAACWHVVQRAESVQNALDQIEEFDRILTDIFTI